MSEYQGNIIIKNPATPTGPSALGSAPGMWRLNDVAYWIKQGVWPDANILPDTYFKYVSLLLSTTSLGNASNNLFVDSSGAFIPLSRFGNTTQGSYTPYSTNWSNYFDGSGDYLTVPSNAALAFGTGDFTIEFWTYRISGANTDNFIISSASSGGFFFGTKSNGWGYGSTGNFWSYNTGVIPALNTWQHVAVSRSGSSLRIFVDGTQIGTTQNDSSDWSLATGGTTIGSQGASYYYNGYISNLRVLKGTALYTSNFTVPTAPLTAISGTSLLTCQSNRFIDNSSNAFTITVNGNTSVNDFGPFSPTYPGAAYNQNDITNWSGYFDGSGDSLSGPSWSAAGNFGTSDFTVEGWFYATGAPQSNNVIWSCNIYPNTTGLILRYVGGGSTDIDVRCGNSGVVAASGGWSFNEWHHVAVVRSSGTLTLYIDGVSRGSASFTNNCTDGLQYIGRPSDTSNFAYQGYMSNFRIVKGTAVYTSAFTPPTTNLTAISGTSLLTLQNAAFTDNSANSYIITPNGEVTVTGNSPFNTVGYWSNYFNGDGNALSAPYNAAFAFPGNFTIECWINYSGHENYAGIISSANPGVLSGGWQIIFNNTADTLLIEYTGGSFTTSTALTRNVWNHIAFVRSGSAMTLYINGVSAGTGTSSATFDSGSYPTRIGVERDVSHYITGYISNVRIVKGTAVYTGAFTPPTGPLTAISGTSLLTCQNGRFIDNSTNNFTITRTGNVSVQSFDPFYTATIASNGGSLYFDGTGDYLNAGSPSDWTFLHNGAVNWTVEYWAYNNNNTTRQDSFSTNTNSTNGAYGITFYQFSSTAQIGVQIVNGIDGNNFNCLTTNSPLLANCWNHVAVTFVTATKTLNIYVNGVLCATTTNAGYAFGSVAPNYTLQVGRWIGSASGVGGYWNGYISNARITRGAVLYTGTFTPPTTPLTPSANTVLLLNGMNAGIYDAATINDMETAGNAQVRYPSPFAPATYYAGAFDGSGDWLTVPNNTALQFGSGDFTVEFWANVSTSSGFRGIIGKGGAATGWAVFIDNSNYWAFSIDNLNYAGTVTPTYGAWTHVALTRSGTTFTLYINGTSVRTQTSSSSFTQTDQLVIGAGRDLTIPYTGSISNVRLVKGTAIYTSNFTPPTAPLTAISGTSLLTCQNKTFIDNSSNAFTITAAGNATAGAIGPFAAAGVTSMYFPNTTDYVSIPDSPNLNFGSGNFTLEAWVYITGYGNGQTVISKGTNFSSGSSWTMRINQTTGYLSWVRPGVAGYASTLQVPTNQWTHIAISRVGTNFYLAVGGTVQTVSGTYQDETGPVILGWTTSTSSAGMAPPYIDDARITKGVARYTTNFTPPTQAFPVY